MRIYLCDESAKERAQIRNCIEKYLCGNYQVSIKEFGSVQQTLAELPSGPLSLMIMNLSEQEMTDPEIVKQLRRRKSNQKLIMTATSERYAMDAFSVYADGFLTKPFLQEQVDCALNRFKSMFYRMKKNISFMVNRTMKDFCMDEIIYMETCGHATMIHTIDGNFRTNCSLTKAKIRMSEENGYFVSCGKSYYINASYIEDVSKKEIILRGGEHIFIPIRLQRELCIKVGDYIARRDDNYEKFLVKNKS